VSGNLLKSDFVSEPLTPRQTLFAEADGYSIEISFVRTRLSTRNGTLRLVFVNNVNREYESRLKMRDRIRDRFRVRKAPSLGQKLRDTRATLYRLDRRACRRAKLRQGQRLIFRLESLDYVMALHNFADSFKVDWESYTSSRGLSVSPKLILFREMAFSCRV